MQIRYYYAYVKTLQWFFINTSTGLRWSLLDCDEEIYKLTKQYKFEKQDFINMVYKVKPEIPFNSVFFHADLIVVSYKNVITQRGKSSKDKYQA